MKKVLLILHKVNIPRQIANSLFGETHTTGHRLLVGALVIVLGVFIAELKPDHHASLAVNTTVDIISFSAHGVGFHPFLEALIKSARS